MVFNRSSCFEPRTFHLAYPAHRHNGSDSRNHSLLSFCAGGADDLANKKSIKRLIQGYNHRRGAETSIVSGRGPLLGPSERTKRIRDGPSPTAYLGGLDRE